MVARRAFGMKVCDTEDCESCKDENCISSPAARAENPVLEVAGPCDEEPASYWQEVEDAHY